MNVKVVLAFAAIYLIWGSTYLAAQFGLDSLPPYVLSVIRFSSAGLILLLWSLFKKYPIPSSRAVMVNSIGGILMLVGGSGSVLWAQQYLSSGLAAILVASLPIWFVLLDKKQWPVYFSDKRIIIGVIVGFLGIVLLFGNGLQDGKPVNNLMKFAGAGAILFGCVLWTVGSLYVKYKAVSAHITTSAGIQLLAAGVFAILPAVILQEWMGFSFSAISMKAGLSLLYLIVPGSVIAFMSYVYLLSVRPAAQAGTHAYVNPVIAVLLGVLFAGEQVGWWQVMGLLLILCSVLLINWKSYQATPADQEL